MYSEPLDVESRCPMPLPLLRLCLTWPLLLIVDQLSKIGYSPHPSELRRLYSENLALKAVNESLRKELHRARNKRAPMSLSTRLAQVYAYLLTRGNRLFQTKFLGSSPATVKTWTARLRHPFTKPKNPGGRPPVDALIVEWVLKIKRENPRFGAVKISKTLARMGIKVSKFTVARILKAHGLDPIDDNRPKLKKWMGTFKDEVWCMDFFFTHLRKGTEVAILLVSDTFTKEILEIRAFERYRFLDSFRVAGTLVEVFRKWKRHPLKLIHDRDPLFKGQVMRLLAVSEIKELKSPPRYPTMNCFAERALQSIKLEFLNHFRVESVEQLQWLLDEYRTWFNEYRAHEALDGMTPSEYAVGKRIADVTRIDDVRAKRLESVEFADGKLVGYRWVDDEQAA